MPTLNQLPTPKVKPFLKVEDYEFRTISKLNRLVGFSMFNTKDKSEKLFIVKNLDVLTAFKTFEQYITKLKL